MKASPENTSLSYGNPELALKAPKKWEFPKIRGPIFKPITRIVVVWGLYGGPIILGNYQMIRRGSSKLPGSKRRLSCGLRTAKRSSYVSWHKGCFSVQSVVPGGRSGDEGTC